MSNTLGTICRVIGLFLLLLSGWFLAVTALYGLVIIMIGATFVWSHVGILFGMVVIGRMLYPRNVFQW
jgi:ABC-type transport system involved in cytochrome bd biosynthesis fused ATPase/permease subunit